MNIGLVIFQAEESLGGAERYTVDIAHGLAKRGHSIHLLAGTFGNEIPGVTFVNLSVRSATRSGQFLDFLTGLDAHLQRVKYDVIHAMLPIRRCDFYHPHGGISKAALAMELGREDGAGSALGRFAGRFNRKRRLYADVEKDLIYGPSRPVVLCLSDYSKRIIERHYPDIPDQLVKLFNGTDLERFDPAKHTGGRKMIREKFGIANDATIGLMVAQNFMRKGLPDVIAATAEIAVKTPDSAPVIVVVGREDPNRARQQAQRLGIEKRIIFAGVTDCMADFYSAADFFVLPTRHDSCSLVVLEALAMGLPVISTIFNGACEAMINGRHGYVLEDPANIEALAAAMTKLLDPHRREAMRSACLSLRPALSQETHLDRLEELYGHV
jgi:UDP-glucose:(heptosyl)LPS alpha-1,3-glucosyltransferase